VLLTEVVPPRGIVPLIFVTPIRIVLSQRFGTGSFIWELSRSAMAECCLLMHQIDSDRSGWFKSQSLSNLSDEF